jgi:hypothetical protein
MKIAFLALLAACGTTIRATPINPEPHPLPPRSPESVEVFASGPPVRPHVDVSFLEAANASVYSTDQTPQFIAKLRVEAAAMGCDGIVIGGVTNRTVGSDGFSERPGNIRGVVATCIAYTDVERVQLPRHAPH